MSRGRAAAGQYSSGSCKNSGKNSDKNSDNIATIYMQKL